MFSDFNRKFMAKKTTEEQAVKKPEPMDDYNFPAYGVTVKARNLQEANEKLKKLLNE